MGMEYLIVLGASKGEGQAERREALCFDFAVSGLLSSPVDEPRRIPGFEPSTESYAPAVATPDVAREGRLLDRAVDMSVDIYDLEEKQRPHNRKKERS